MPKDIYEIEVNGQVYEVEADSQAQAVAAAKAYKPKPGRDEKAAYLKETGKNILPSTVSLVKGTAKGVLDTAGTVARATGELGGVMGGRLREIVGLDPGYPSTENIDKVVSGVKNIVPGVIDHYTGRYGSPEAREATVRDDPAGMVADMAGLTAMGKLMKTGVKAGARVTGRGAAGVAQNSELLDAVTGESGIMARMRRYAQSTGDPNIPSRPFTPSAKSDYVLHGTTPEPPQAPVPGSRLVPGPGTPPQSLEQALDDALKAGAAEERAARGVELGRSHPDGGSFTVPQQPTGNTGGRLTGHPAPLPPMEDELAGAIAEGQAPTRVDLPLSHPTGGEFTVPPPVDAMPNVGGRLGGTAAPPVPMEEIIRQALEEARGLGRMRNETAAADAQASRVLASSEGSPSVTMSPAAQAAARGRTPAKAPVPTPAPASTPPPADLMLSRMEQSSKRSVQEIPPSTSKRTPMSKTPGLTVNDMEVLGLNPELKLKGLTPDAISRLLRARLARSGQYRTEAQLDAALKRLLNDPKQ